ncbi:zinc finger protein 37-like [Varroa destructor]|uniref:C2H2-type domain-containing protein n=1 Tax=Varroa destructor TaxID=109461 RepID=A0A7M7KR28_VARDE|nr:zinc finger protein 37-like [Varroa destructor]XP_022670674.1 zinc finger protein 37-like [Varroa destructor]XP_022670684.1 zinc finger protein 37-like [Varroa destructor]XP_022670693.1 zinc finger protein 37-like [Varroa destructor]XP_022670700.1 zinc finger protein 37-like [Varroa destructor]XP_022670707.1 zinc finger protein 37-like [Varroa destructor]XP_022670717.1 zinc finger protein 37-like [Varroa destructor]
MSNETLTIKEEQTERHESMTPVDVGLYKNLNPNPLENIPMPLALAQLPDTMSPVLFDSGPPTPTTRELLAAKMLPLVEPAEILPTPSNPRWTNNGRQTSAVRMLDLAVTIERQIVQNGGKPIRHRNHRNERFRLKPEIEAELQPAVSQSSGERTVSIGRSRADLFQGPSLTIVSGSTAKETGEDASQASTSTTEGGPKDETDDRRSEQSDGPAGDVDNVDAVDHEDDDDGGDEDDGEGPGMDFSPECILQEGVVPIGEIAPTSCQCGFTTSDISEMKAHTCPEGTLVKCQFCPKTFRRADLARRHSRNAHPELNKVLVCPEEGCTYRTRDAPLFERHVMRHKGIKFCECDQCDYKTDSPKCLRIHKLTHSGEKPFACHLCDYRGTQRGHLRDHIRLVHIKSKDFHCEICGMQFGIKGALKRHIKNIHEKPNKTYTCNECGYVTARRDRLREHYRSHSGEKPFACTLCSYRTASRQSLNKHAKGHLKRAVKALNMANQVEDAQTLSTQDDAGTELECGGEEESQASVVSESFVSNVAAQLERMQRLVRAAQHEAAQASSSY